ncbi:hypothetical protein EW146_g4969 [Bondarzewia mesenterica]|uniref:SH3 domain-containing protein n=1 Tax=Bondarzewia mesenterica TaxID=1095465 RepID=A0A4S4LUQ0_9AGAM|nr:hypothetical protein EW146_g4969 [Bondarzewia mesenterica]
MEARRPQRQDTFDLRGQIITDDEGPVVHVHNETYPSDEEHSVLEDDSDTDDRDGDYADEDDHSSSLSIPNESINFDLVYSLHSFAATVEGQASVVKGDSLTLMDDSNSYWWLVRVLNTQEIGYIPAENIETPFERLARLNKHRNVDLASATQAELQNGVQESRDHFRNNMSSRAGSHQNTPSPTAGAPASRARRSKAVIFTSALQVHRYPPAVWGDEEEEEEGVEWDDEGYEDEDPSLVEDVHANDDMGMEPDDGMSWEDGAAEEARTRQLEGRAQGARVEDQQEQELQAQRQQVEEQQQRQQQQQQLMAQQQHEQQQRQAATLQAQGPALSLRKPDSRERLAGSQESPESASSSTSGAPLRSLDPAEAVETRKVSVTPIIARDGAITTEQRQPQASGPILPSAVMQQQEEERKRTREEIEALENEARKKSKPNTVSQRSPNGGAKLRKERDSGDEESGKDKDKKSKSGLFGGLFGRRKDKSKDKGSLGSLSDIGHADAGRSSEESGRSSNYQHVGQPDITSPTTVIAQRQQQQQIQRAPAPAPSTPPQDGRSSGTMSPVSQHAIQLRQRDQQQQALYQQYLNRSPSSPPEAQPSFGLQSVSAVMNGSLSFSSTSSSTGLGPPSDGRRPRPGSLVLAPNSFDGQGVGVPELSVIRIFAGKKLQTEATFKTVLLNSLTTSSDLVKQAIQRFRLPAGEDANDYYLTVKQVEGSSAILRQDEHPLVVFETLVEAAMELPKVKRSSVGSISSISSNLSMHPAIKKLPMNDFTDDSAVKFYLNRRSERGADDSMHTDEGDDTLMAESVQSDEEPLSPRPQYLNVSGAGTTVPPERFSSPSFRFALRLVINPDDLPDDMIFDPLTEAIIFKHTLRDRSQSSTGASSGISQAFRRKIFVFPKNITVAEVIEIGLERYGILEGVVDGGDEVEDKLSKRRSTSRVRYALNVNVEGKERELSPSSRVIDAYPRPPAYRAVDRRFSDSKRRSVDSMQLLGSPEDVQPDDPIFVLRRAVTYRTSSRRLSTALDEIALQHMHRESVSSSATSDVGNAEEPKQRHMSKQELIAAQRAATRANQRAILSAQTNSVRGVDVLLPGNAMIRSSRYEVDDRMRYSYVQPDGETYDISDIVEEEWQGEATQRREAASDGDLLEGVLSRHKDGLGEKLDRVLSKIKDSRGVPRVPVSQATSASTLDSIASEYSIADAADQSTSRSTTPSAAQLNARSPTPTSAKLHILSDAPHSASPVTTGSTSGTATPVGIDQKRPRTNTPTTSSSKTITGTLPHLRQPSIASVISDLSGYRTAVGSPEISSPPLAARKPATPKPYRPRPVIPKDDFGISNMMAIIELAGMQNRTPPLSPLDPVDELLFGRQIDLETLHPRVRDIYAPTFQQLEEMDKILDELLQHAVRL